MSGIIVAPFSNSGIRDWPGTHFSALIGLLLEGPAGNALIHVVGTRNHALRAREIVRPFAANRVINQCGRMSWAEVVGSLKGARCVIANNSGLSHLGGHFGVPTVCVFGGTHQRREWRPIGSSVILVSRAIGCSPCQLDHGHISPYDKACLRQIEPRTVADAAILIMERVARSREISNDILPQSTAFGNPQ